jgi:hypothetical protein
MTKSGRKQLRAWQCLMVGVLGMLALPVCAGSKTAPAPPESKRNIGAAAPGAIPAPTSSHGSGNAVKTVVRNRGESPEQLAARVLPAGANTITKPLELELGALGKVVLVLYDVGSDDPVFVSDPSVYRGFVLVPAGEPATYRIEPLPSQCDGAGVLMYEVKSVFAADADGDGAPELCVLSESRQAGETGKSHTDTDIFRWSGSRFTVMEQDDSRPLSDLRTAKAVRAKLKRIRIR